MLNQEIKELKNALAKASIKFTQKKKAANKAINKWEDTCVLIASLSQPTQEVINVDEDKLDNKKYNKEAEFNKEVEFDEEAEFDKEAEFNKKAEFNKEAEFNKYIEGII